MAVEWSKLRHWDGSQNTAFEMLVCQLAEYERVPDGSTFVRKGAPDAGVECYWQLPDGRELGWQAKFFTSSPTAQQWGQVDSSVKNALDKHPNLQSYTICMAVDRSDARSEGQKSFLDRWNDRVEKWEGWAFERNMCVDFSFWGTHEIVERLSRDEHQGRHFYWFNEEILSPTWFQRQLDDAIAAIGPRYTPELNVQLPISKVFDSLSRSPAFLASFQEAYGDLGKAWSRGSWRIVEEIASDDFANLQERLQSLIRTAKRFDKQGIEPIDWSEMESQAREVFEEVGSIERLIVDFELNQPEDAEKAGQGSGKSSTRDRLDYAQYDLRRIQGQLREFDDFVCSVPAMQANRPALLLVGDAGTGKTHLFGDAASNCVKSGAPAVLLLGNRFRDDEPWGQILRMLGLSCERDQFLGALQAAAQLSERRAVIFIDALNEGEGRRMWEKWLPSMLECLTRYPWIAIAVSVRSSYEEWIIPAGLAPDKLIRHVHQGFAGHEYDAAKAFFEYYGIQLPATPMLTPEFQNPLFLRCFCQGLHNRRLTSIPTGIKGITSVFDFFLDSVNEKLSKPELLNYDRRSHLVSKATSKLAEWISQANMCLIPREEAKAMCDSLLPNRSYEQSLFQHLLSEGVITETTGFYDDDSEFSEMVMFSYERLADHLIMRKFIDTHVDLQQPEAAFAEDQSLGRYFEDESACWHNRGLLDALAIQGPEVLRREIFELIPGVQDSRPVCEAFIKSLIWRDPDVFSEGCLPYINAHIARERSLNNEFMNTILMIAPIPSHPFNAEFLHSTLFKLEMAERDAGWSFFLHHYYGEESSIDRLIDWAWSDTDRSHISAESIRLAGTALSWFLTTSHRFLRDRATKALVSLFVERIDVLCQLIPIFVNVNDLYVLERLYAVAYGCALRSNDAHAKASLAQQVYDLVFRDGTPPCHILLRDYARGVVEVAISDGAELDIDHRKIRPPYEGEWPLEIPSEGEMAKYGERSEGMPEEERALRSIYDSVMGYGDFARYVIGRERKSLQWSNRRLDEDHLPTPKEQFEAFEESLTERQRKAWLYYQIYRHQVEQFREGVVDTPGISPERIQGIVVVLSTELEKEERRFRRTLGMKKANFLSEVILPYLDDPPAEEDKFDLPPSIAQRWIFKRVLDLGWTVERFGWFDWYVSRSGNYYRSAHKPERIGKKYQWIAYHEFLAHLADNLEFREESWSDKPGVYDGPWQLGRRDIDPSSLLRRTYRSHFEPHVLSWWAPTQFNAWEEEPDETLWLKSVDLLPPMTSLPIVTDPQTGREWFVLECFYEWEEPTSPEVYRYDVSRRHIWYGLSAYLVKSDDEENFCCWTRKHHFKSHWIHESQSLIWVFLGEFFRLPAFEYFDNPDNDRNGWTRGNDNQHPLPCDILVTTDSYLHEDGHYDCSIEDTVSIYLPASWLVDKMELAWRGDDGRFFDRADNLVAQDPSIRTAGPKALLVDKKLMSDFLDSKGYRLVWTVQGEKNIQGDRRRDEDMPGWMEISGYMRMKDGQVFGEANTYWNTAGSEPERIRTISIP